MSRGSFSKMMVPLQPAQVESYFLDRKRLGLIAECGFQTRVGVSLRQFLEARGIMFCKTPDVVSIFQTMRS